MKSASFARSGLALAMAATLGLFAGPISAQPGKTMILRDNHADPQNARSAEKFRTLKAKPDTDLSVIAELKAEQLDQPPYFLLELSRRLLPTDKAAAAEYWLLARIRMAYDVQRCADRSAAADFNMRFAIPVTEVVLSDKPGLEVAKAKVLRRPDLFAGRADPWWICLHGMAAISAAMRGNALSRDEYLTPESEWAAIRQKLQASLAPQPAESVAAPR